MKKIFCSCVVLALLFCCKKKSTTNSTPASGSGGSSGWYAILGVAKQLYLNAGVLQTTYGAVAYFSSSPTSGANPSTAVLVDTARFNGVIMQYQSSVNEYMDTVGMSVGVTPPISYPYTFKIAGKNGIPSFTYTENYSIPTYTGYASLPDTIKKSNTLMIPLSGISGADSVLINISDGSYSAGHTASAYVPSTATTATFTAASMTQFSLTANGSIEILLIKKDNQTIGNKPMQFSVSTDLIKTVSIK
jgi:hypothetical protein